MRSTESWLKNYRGDEQPSVMIPLNPVHPGNLIVVLIKSDNLSKGIEQRIFKR